MGAITDRDGPGVSVPGQPDHGDDLRYTFFTTPTAGSPPKNALFAKNIPETVFST